MKFEIVSYVVFKAHNFYLKSASTEKHVMRLSRGRAKTFSNTRGHHTAGKHRPARGCFICCWTIWASQIPDFQCQLLFFFFLFLFRPSNIRNNPKTFANHFSPLVVVPMSNDRTRRWATPLSFFAPPALHHANKNI